MNQGTAASPATADSAHERVCYRDEDEFNKAMDAAVNSILAKQPNLVGNIAWYGVLALLAFFYLADWIFDLEWRDTLIPGVDLVKPLWATVVIMIIAHHAWSRNQQPRIISQRKCLDCGRSLLDVPTDAAGDGTCPACERAFNLGEYRRPGDNRGRGFQGYLDRDHYDKAMFTAAEQIRAARGFGFEGDLQGWLWIALGVSFGASIVFDWNVFEFLPYGLPWHGIWFVSLLIWGAIYAARVKRIRPEIERRMLCFDCGFCLQHTPRDDDGVGRCPECGAEFVAGQFEPPPGTEDDSSDA